MATNGGALRRTLISTRSEWLKLGGSKKFREKSSPFNSKGSHNCFGEYGVESRSVSAAGTRRRNTNISRSWNSSTLGRL